MADFTTKHREKLSQIFRSGFFLGDYIVIFFLLQTLFPSSGLVGFLYSTAFFCTPALVAYQMKVYRQKVNGGNMSFGQAWLFGTLMFLVAAVLTGIIYYVTYSFLKPNFLNETYYNNTLPLIENMKSQGMFKSGKAAEYLEQILSVGPPTAIQTALSSIWGITLGGSLLSLILAFFFARKRIVQPTGKDETYTPYGNSSNQQQEETKSADDTDDTEKN